MNLDDNFKSAADRATKLPKRPPNDILLQLYALYKQGNEGDVTGDRPGFADFEGRAKFDAWNKIKGNLMMKQNRSISPLWKNLNKKLQDKINAD